jgi:predicted ArsR family transcriptional regulator
MADILRQHLLDTSRGRIVTLLRDGPSTVEDVAASLGLTRSAVRLQMSAMEQEGVVRKTGKRPGTTRPSHVFELTPEVEQLLSKAYVPLLTHLVRVFADALPAGHVDALLKETGKALASDLARGKRRGGSLWSRAAAASELMNEQLGALTRVEGNGGIVIRGAGCPLAALTGKHRGVCLAMESMVAEIVGAPVRECCDRDDRPRCCFEIQSGARKSR